jgi:hypothetical protein
MQSRLQFVVQGPVMPGSLRVFPVAGVGMVMPLVVMSQ